MPSVPNEAILGEVKGKVQGKAKFHHAQIAGKMSRSYPKYANQLVTHFLRKLLKLFFGKLLQVFRGFDSP